MSWDDDDNMNTGGAFSSYIDDVTGYSPAASMWDDTTTTSTSSWNSSDDGQEK